MLARHKSLSIAKAMSVALLLAALKYRFSQWPWLLLALQQDALVWEALSDTDLGGLMLETSPTQPEDWSPAALSLLALGNTISLDEVRSVPLQPLDTLLGKQASRANESWFRTQETPTTLAQAGLLALAHRERFRLAGRWDNLLVGSGLTSDAGRTVLACLFGMIPEPIELFNVLLQHGDGINTTGLALHALLSNPLSDQAQIEILGKLQKGLRDDQRLDLLCELSLQRPWLATSLSSSVLEEQVEKSPALRADGTPGSDGVLSAGLERLISLARLARVHQFAAQPEESVPLLAEALRALRRMRGHLSASLAQAIAQAKRAGDGEWAEAAQETGLQAWKRAVQLVPDEPLYSAGLIAALVAANRPGEARSYLQRLEAEERQALHPSLALASAMVAARLGEEEETRRVALQALELVEGDYGLEQSEFLVLAHFFYGMDMLPEALRVSQIALKRYPFSRDLLALRAQLYASLGEHALASVDAYATLALEEISPDEARSQARADLLPSDGSAVRDGSLESSLRVKRWDIQRLLVDSLESLSAWDAALSERAALMEGLDSNSVEDLRALANCALRAGKPDEAFQVCQKVLQIDPDDVVAHRLLADAAQARGDYSTAVEHFSYATRLAPDQAEAWTGLARTYGLAGQDAQALEALRAASQAVPNDSRVHLELGEAYLERQAPTQALACFQRAASLSSSAHVALRLGQTLSELGHHEQARRVLQEAYESSLGIADGLDGTTGSCEGSYSEGVELTYAYARTLLELGELSPAISLLKDVVCSRPDDPHPCLDLVKALMLAGEQPEGAERAIPLLCRILGIALDGNGDLSPNRMEVGPELHAEAQTLLAEAYAAVGQLDKSMDAFRLALELPSNRGSGMWPRLALGLGQVALRLDQPETAVVALQDAVQAEPLDADLQRALSEAYLANSLIPEAFQAARAARDLAPSDSKTLVWFIEQGVRLADQPGSAQLPVRAEVIQALKSATPLAPERSDLLLLLGRLNLENGDQPAAQDAFHRFLSTDDEVHGATIDELCQAAIRLRELGDPQLAASLLNRAVERYTAEAPSAVAADAVQLSDLYTELALAYQQGGDDEAALGALDQAIAADGSRVDLYRLKADLLYETGRFEQTLECLEAASHLEPQDAELRYRLALLSRLLGDLPVALAHAKQAITALGKTQEADFGEQLYTLAAEVAYRMLKPQQSRMYLENGPLEFGVVYNDYKHASLQAELALDVGDEATAAQAVILMRDLAPGHPRCLAAQARLACSRGDQAAGAELFLSARQALEAIGAIGRDETVGVDSHEDIMSLLSVCQAAIDAARWENALSLTRHLIELAPNDPRSYLKLIQALVLRAEAQNLCQALDVIGHAPGETALGNEALQSFKGAAQTLMDQVNEAEALQDLDSTDSASTESRGMLAVWLARGRVAFQPDSRKAQTLGQVLKMVPPRPDDLAALVMALDKCGDHQGAVAAMQMDWHPRTTGSGLTDHPLVLTQLALALEEVDPDHALEVAREARERGAVRIGGGWPPLAMLHFLLARLAHRAGAHALALNAVRKALADWEDEAGWHFVASEIYLTQDASADLPDQAEALTHLERSVVLEPGNALHHLALGRLYMDAGQVQRAVQALEQASRLEAERGEIWLVLSQAQQALGDLDQAAASAERAIESASDPVAALLLHGEIALQMGDPSGAQNRAQAILRTHPANADALYLLARGLDALGKPAEALTALEKAIPSLESPFILQLERANLVRRSQGLEAALTALRELTERYGKRPELLALLSDWLEDAGDREAALQAARLALQEDQGDLPCRQRAVLHFRIGLNMRQAGQLDQAIHLLSEAVEENPSHLEAYLELGQAYRERREYKQALKIYQKAINVTGGDYRPYYQAGQVLKDNKDYLAAEGMLRRAAQLAPNEVSVHRLLGAVVALNLVHNRRMGKPDS